MKTNQGNSRLHTKKEKGADGKLTGAEMRRIQQRRAFMLNLAKKEFNPNFSSKLLDRI